LSCILSNKIFVTRIYQAFDKLEKIDNLAILSSLAPLLNNIKDYLDNFYEDLI